MFKESHFRSAIKAFSWRFWATVTTMFLVYIFTGTIKIALAIGGLEVVLKMLIYFLHERAWDKIRFGKKEITPFVLWFTGLPSSGKTTLANVVYEKISSNGYRVQRLDGDKVRNIFPATGFSKEERNTHIQRVGFCEYPGKKRYHCYCLFYFTLSGDQGFCQGSMPEFYRSLYGNTP